MRIAGSSDREAAFRGTAGVHPTRIPGSTEYHPSRRSQLVQARYPHSPVRRETPSTSLPCRRSWVRIPSAAFRADREFSRWRSVSQVAVPRMGETRTDHRPSGGLVPSRGPRLSSWWQASQGASRSAGSARSAPCSGWSRTRATFRADRAVRGAGARRPPGARARSRRRRGSKASCWSRRGTRGRSGASRRPSPRGESRSTSRRRPA